MMRFVWAFASLATLTSAGFGEPIFAPNAKLKVEAKGGVGGEGPAWHPKFGVLCSGNGHINQVDRKGKVRIWRKDAGTNGLLFDAQGRLLACEPKLRRVTRTEADGKITVLTDRYQGKRYNQPNDLTVDSRGRIYFTDPRYGSRDGMEIRDEKGKAIEGVYRIDPDGKVTRIITHEVDRPNGILVSADDRFLFVADNNNNTRGGARKLWRFDLNQDGTVDLASRKLLHDWGQGRGPDGIKQDVKGRLYVAGGLNKPNPPFEPAKDVKGGIYVFSPEGKLLDFLPVPRDEVTNCAFGGDDLKTLYITAGGTLFSIRTTTPGRVVFPRNERPKPPKGFQAIFNGKDLTGWKGSSKYWKVEDGCLTGTADGTLKYNRFIVWKGGTVKNFELRVKVKVSPGGNSGLQYRSTERPDLGESVVVGYQCDIVSRRADYDGMLYEERGRRILAHTGEKVIIDEKGQPWVVGEFPLKKFKPGEWHEYRVLVEGNRHRHWIDGHPTVDVIDLDETNRKLEGVLGVQVHVGPPMKIQFKDFFLKKLPDDLPVIKAKDARIPANAKKVVPQGKDKPKRLK
ncbi:MAG: hypothetical protein KatS3mg105_0456 [Gemmatales bacterium]|nr:MAG: hypothetical protein KatS3mg105_0456 [Gemmatales bacterium]